MKRSFKNIRIKFILPLLSILFLYSCNDNSNEINQIVQEESVEITNYSFGDGNDIQVKLDPNYVHASRVFTSIDEQNAYLEALEQNGEMLVVNKKMYNDLKHYFDPFLISVLDQNATVRVGDAFYKATSTTAYKRTVGSSEWKLHIYYGLSGEEDLKETAMIYENYHNLDALKGYDFKNPTAKKVFSEELVNLKTNGGIDRGTTTSYYYFNNNTGEPYQIRYRDCYNCTVRTARIRWRCWNKEYRNFWGKKADGGTVTEIFRDTNPQQGWSSMSGTSPIGAYHANNTPDASTPYTWVKVYTDKKDGGNHSYSWSVSKSKVKRKGNATSKHTAKIRYNDTNASTQVMTNFSVN